MEPNRKLANERTEKKSDKSENLDKHGVGQAVQRRVLLHQQN